MTSTDSIAIKKILATAAEYGASDLHLSPGNPPILRIDGKLTPLETEPIILWMIFWASGSAADAGTVKDRQTETRKAIIMTVLKFFIRLIIMR